MKAANFRETNWILAELRLESFHARAGELGIDLVVKRDGEKRLTPDSAAEVVQALQRLAGQKSWRSRVRLVCAIDSRGLIFRPFSLPAIGPAEVSRFLQLQLEGDFPLPPDSLAWGWIPRSNRGEKLAKTGGSSTPAVPFGVPARVGLANSAGPVGKVVSPDPSEVWVAAVRKEIVEELAALFKPITTELVFTPATLARQALIPKEVSGFALLDVGGPQTELTLGESGSVPSIRLLSWGTSELGEQTNDPNSPVGDEAVRRLLSLLPAAARKLPLWIAGPPGCTSRLAQLLAGQWNGNDSPRILAPPAGPGQTAAIAGLAQLFSGNGGSSRDTSGAGLRSPGGLLDLSSQPTERGDRSSRQLPVRPLAVAAALFALVLLLPYLEAFLFQPRLARRLAELKSGNAQLAIIDREFSFLRYLEQNQAPHLDATFVIAQAAPQGSRVLSISMNRQGEVSLTGFLRDLAQVGDFRLKLINSGFFSTVVVEDQSPTPDRQRINFRINARWKDASERESLELGPVLTNAPAPLSASNRVAAPSLPSRPIPIIP